jgi:thiol-disulfide isomerase/thioredoxin
MMVVVLLVVAVAVTLAVGQGGDSGNEALVKKIESLEQRIASLERTLSERLAAIERGIAQGGGPSADQEQAARTAYGKISGLVSSGNYEQAKTEMAAFMKQYGSTNTAKQARRLSSELAVIGKSTPASWGIEKWFQGESDVDLASDQTTLLVFWEVWCPHCKREVPKLQALYDSLHDDGLQIVGLTKVNRSATEESVRSFMAEQNLSYPVAKEDGSLSAHFSVQGVPAAAVVKDGKVIWRGHPARLSEDMLKGWM